VLKIVCFILFTKRITNITATNVNKAFDKITKKVISQMKPDDIVYVFSLEIIIIIFLSFRYDHKINLNMDEAKDDGCGC
jgi:hypothetical protein